MLFFFTCKLFIFTAHDLFISTLQIERQLVISGLKLSRLGKDGLPSLESGKEIVILSCCHVFVLCCEHILFFGSRATESRNTWKPIIITTEHTRAVYTFV